MDNVPVIKEEVEEDAPPGNTIMWFGKHEGTRIDQLEQGYARFLLKVVKEKPWPNLVKFKDLYTRYLNQLDESECPLTTTKVWFGSYIGDTLAKTYFDKRRWFWLLENCPQYKSELLEVEERYLRWQKSHPPINGFIARRLSIQRSPQDNSRNEPLLESRDQEDHHERIHGNQMFYNQRETRTPPPELSNERLPNEGSASRNPPVTPPESSQMARAALFESQPESSQDRRVKLEEENEPQRQQNRPDTNASDAGPSTPVRIRKRPSNNEDESSDELDSKPLRNHNIEDSDSDMAPLPTPSRTGPRAEKSGASHSTVRRKSTPIIIDDSDDGPYPTPSRSGHKRVKREYPPASINLDSSDEEIKFVRKRSSTPVVLSD